MRRKGETVSSWELETTVSAFPGVVECAAVGVPSDLGEDEILGAVVAEDGFDPAALVTFCRERMAAHQVPRYVRLVPELPRTQTERVDSAVLELRLLFRVARAGAR